MKKVLLARPFPIVILGIDPGKEWGASIFVDKNLAGYYSASDSDIKTTIAKAVDAANMWGRRLVVCSEKWVVAGKWGHQSVANLNAEWGKWLGEIESLEPRRPAIRIVRFYPQTWRSRVLGGRRTSEQWKQMAVGRVKYQFGADVNHNVAEAILIAVCGTQAPEVQKCLSKKEVEYCYG